MKFLERRISQCILPFINCSKFTGKHLCYSLFFNKFAGLRTATLLKKKLWHMCFPVNFTKFLLLWTTASDFTCGVFFIFSIIKNFRHEISRFVRKKFDQWKTGLKHTKEISKQKATFHRIISYLQKNEETTNHDEIQQILDKLISENRIQASGKSDFISTTVDIVLVPET